MSEAKETGHQLHVQIEAARVLLANWRDILGDDAEARADAVEGQTSLLEAIEQGMNRIVEIEALETGIASILNNLKARKERLEQQKETLRTALAVALEVGEVKKLETALGTISLRTVPPKVEIITESEIPGKFWKPQDPKLDKKAVLDALKAKEVVPGAVLSNGAQVIQITPR